MNNPMCKFGIQLNHQNRSYSWGLGNGDWIMGTGYWLSTLPTPPTPYPDEVSAYLSDIPSLAVAIQSIINS
jgi:hypothetical protein